MLQKFRSGRFARVCGLGHFLPFFVRHAAYQKFDGIWLDLEHRAMDTREVQAIVAMCHRYDVDCMVRTPTLERTGLYRYLEEGASGFLVPLISDVETARQVVDAAKFPPVGNRGIDGAGLDGDYTLDAWKPGIDYCDDANRQTFILIQIETVQAIDQIEPICALEGVDGLFIGPSDLSRRMAFAKGLTLEQTIAKVAEVTRRHGKVWGITAGTLEDLSRFRKLGAQIVPRGGDFALAQHLATTRKELDQVLDEA